MSGLDADGQHDRDLLPDHLLAEFERTFRVLDPPIYLEAADIGSIAELEHRRREVEQAHGTRITHACVFDARQISRIRTSTIPVKLRPTKWRLDSFYVLSLNPANRRSIEVNTSKISEIANTYPASNASVQERYQTHFLALSRLLGEHFKSVVGASNGILIAPLRAGLFVAHFGFSSIGMRQIHVHTKRILLSDGRAAVLISQLPFPILRKARRVVFCDAGLVSGITLMSLMETMNQLGALPKSISVCVVHCSWYGLMNVLESSKRIGTAEFSVHSCFPSYSINDDLRAVCDTPGQRGRLVTGDVGDYLSPVRIRQTGRTE